MVTRSAEETEAVAAELAGELRPGDVLLLVGDLAAGKTTFVRGLVGGLGGDPAEVSSPSFVLLQSYTCGAGSIRRLHHLDLYRLDGDGSVLREAGVEEVLSDVAAVVCIEWPRGPIAAWLPSDSRQWRVELDTLPDDGREVLVRGPLAVRAG
jgi:tRNA threonylcarbamoyladenosine biosynthesis protein TsaE